MNKIKIAVQLRAFRAAAVTVLTVLLTSCSPDELSPDTCPGGCDGQMLWDYEKDANGYYHVPLDWTGEYLPYFFVDVTASWCVTCQFNKNTVLKTKDIQTFFKDNKFSRTEYDAYQCAVFELSRLLVLCFRHYKEQTKRATTQPQMLFAFAPIHMYYLKMKTAVKPDLKAKTLCISKSSTRLVEKEICLVNFKLYQKFFVLLISFLTILIFPESPKELANICESYNSKKICNVW